MREELRPVEGYKAGMVKLAQGMMKAQTTQDCEEVLNASGLFKSVCKLTGIPFNVAQQVAGTYFRVFRDFPFLAARIDGVGVYEGSGSVFAHCHMEGENRAFDGGAVHLNTRHFSDARKCDEAYRDVFQGMSQKGFHPENTDYKAIISHELGHTLDGYLTGLELCGKKTNGQRNRVSEYLRKRVLKQLKLKVSDIEGEVSGYARKATFEWFAECFAEYMNSRTPRPMCMECMYQLKQLIIEQA